MILYTHGDTFSRTVVRQCKEGHTYTTAICPLCDLPLGDPPLDDEDVAGQERDIGICECCGEEYYKKMTEQRVCLKRACQRWRKRQDEVRRGR